MFEKKGDWVTVPTYRCLFCAKFETDDCEFVESEKTECENYTPK